jgi:DNA cross-link repair 1A protein
LHQNKTLADAVKSELFNPRVLFVFGTYTIGKERIFLEASEQGWRV